MLGIIETSKESHTPSAHFFSESRMIFRLNLL
jgi:hypothetical protein